MHLRRILLPLPYCWALLCFSQRCCWSPRWLKSQSQRWRSCRGGGVRSSRRWSGCARAAHSLFAAEPEDTAHFKGLPAEVAAVQTNSQRFVAQLTQRQGHSAEVQQAAAEVTQKKHTTHPPFGKHPPGLRIFFKSWWPQTCKNVFRSHTDFPKKLKICFSFVENVMKSEELPADTVAVNHRQEVTRVSDGIRQERCQLALTNLSRLRPQELTHPSEVAFS